MKEHSDLNQSPSHSGSSRSVAASEHAGWSGQERRRFRSEAAGDAVEMALNWSVARGSLKAIVVSDEKGMAVCSSCCDLDLTPVAAVLPIVARGQATARITREGQLFPVSVRELQLGDETLFVGALGGTDHMREHEVVRSLQAIQRILG